MTHASEEQLVLYYYGESGEGSSLETHLAACEQCRSEYRSLQLALNVLDGVPLPEVAPDYGAAVWERIRSAVPAARAQRTGFFRRFAFAGAMAAMVVLAFFVGRWSPREVELEPAAANPAVRERVLLVAMGDHLERSEMVLVELVNAPDGRAVDISAEQRTAEDLLDTNRLLRTTAADAGETAAANVLEDLERVLLEIVHAPSELSRQELNEIRHRIEAQGILFRIRVLDRSERETL
jgi:hypothetical protein